MQSSLLFKKKQRDTLLKNSVTNEVFGSNCKKLLLNNHRYSFQYFFPIFKMLRKIMARRTQD